MRHTILVLAAAFWVATTPARGAEITVSQRLFTTVIHINGTIYVGDEKKFADLNYNYAVVWLTSPGGQVGPAIDIGKMIWKRGWTTLSIIVARACQLAHLSGSAGERRQFKGILTWCFTWPSGSTLPVRGLTCLSKWTTSRSASA